MKNIYLSILFLIFSINTANAAYFDLTLKEVEKSMAQQLHVILNVNHLKSYITNSRKRILFNYNRPIKYSFEDIEYKNNRWSAKLLIKDGDKILQVKLIRGKWEELLEIPVFKHRMRSGTIANISNIGIKLLPESKLRGDVIMDSSEIISKVAKRTISANRAIKKGELHSVYLINKGDIVQMSYISGFMQIFTDGEALSSGAIGDNIRIKNNDSNHIIYGKVIAKGKVEVNR